MDYKKIHDQIIERAKSENRQKGGEIYYEAHHIIPKCLGGEGKAYQWKTHPNIVLLTAKEHLLIHKILCFLYPKNKSLIYAYWCMCTLQVKQNNFRVFPNLKDYEELKEIFSKINSKEKKGNTFRLGVVFSKESKEKISNSLKGKKQEVVNCPYCSKSGGKHAMKQFHFENCNKKPGNEYKIRKKVKYKIKTQIQCKYCNFSGTENQVNKYHEKRCFYNPNKKIKKSSISEESNIKRSNTMKGKNVGTQKKIECPHCNKIGGQSIMKRHHFENCKLKK